MEGPLISMSKLRSMHDAIAEFVSDGSSVAMGLQMEQMIPFAAGHEIIRQKKRDLTLIGPNERHRYLFRDPLGVLHGR